MGSCRTYHGFHLSVCNNGSRTPYLMCGQASASQRPGSAHVWSSYTKRKEPQHPRNYRRIYLPNPQANHTSCDATLTQCLAQLLHGRNTTTLALPEGATKHLNDLHIPS